MCDERTEQDNERAGDKPGTVDRRGFRAAVGGGDFCGGFPAACSPGEDGETGAGADTATGDNGEAASAETAEAVSSSTGPEIIEQRIDIAMGAGGRLRQRVFPPRERHSSGDSDVAGHSRPAPRL